MDGKGLAEGMEWFPAPAVGEKKRFELRAAAGLAPVGVRPWLLFERRDTGSVVWLLRAGGRRSRETVDMASPALPYIDLRPWGFSLTSGAKSRRAARLTDRSISVSESELQSVSESDEDSVATRRSSDPSRRFIRRRDLRSDQAMTTRQARTATSMAARIAPTMMKTEPSGRLLFCMNGALDVSGTTWVTGPTPAIVGSEPVSEKPTPELVRDGASVMDMLLPAALEPDDVAAAEAAELRLGTEVTETWDAESADEPWVADCWSVD